MENIPPSQEAFLEHAKRAFFESGHIYGQALVSEAEVPSPGKWGWEELIRSGLLYGLKYQRLPNRVWNLLVASVRKPVKGNVNATKVIYSAHLSALVMVRAIKSKLAK